jgi:hypothetical protein
LKREHLSRVASRKIEVTHAKKCFARVVVFGIEPGTSYCKVGAQLTIIGGGLGYWWHR